MMRIVFSGTFFILFLVTHVFAEESTCEGICKPLKSCPPLLALSKTPVSEENKKILRESFCSRNETHVFVCCPKDAESLPEHRVKNCKNPSGHLGSCVKITSCPEISKIFQSPSLTPAMVSFLRLSQCGFVEKTAYVCCTFDSEISVEVTTNKITEMEEAETPDWVVSLLDKVPQPPHCGVQLISRIFGGKDAKIDEFPWLALLEYEEISNHVETLCSGSLINERYVITAAHCIRRTGIWKLSKVVLGEWRLSTEIDCDPDDETFCAPPVQKIAVEESFVHPQYQDNSKHQNNDIALLLLAEKVSFSEFVSPICLPFESALWKKDYTNYTFEISGWGKTESSAESDIKLKVQISHYDFSKCQSFYAKQRKRIVESQLCVGGQAGKDSCNGDSGGPLMRYHTGSTGYWYLAGIVSYGPSQCGVEEKPGVYTRVSKFLEWISQTIKSPI